MSDLKPIDLFSNIFWKTNISPDSFNKKELMEVLEKNYQKDPKRNKWGDPTRSSWNHELEDWGNPSFIPANLKDLNVQYNRIINEFVLKQKFNTAVNYKYKIVNLTANKSGSYMHKHSHEGSFYAAVHYINLKKEHGLTTFFNGNNSFEYTLFCKNDRDLLDTKEIQNSQFFNTWQLETQENDFIIFPGFLHHEVNSKNDTDELRVTVSINITIQKA